MGDGSGTSNDRSADGGSNSTFPPVGSPDRYDMIVQRGRTLRRRRRYTLGAGAGGTVVALAVAVVLITNGGSDNTNSTETNVAEFASDSTATSEAIVETTTSAPMPTVMTVTIDAETSTVLVQDPAQPVHDDAKQCVYLSVTAADGTVVAEGSGCNTSASAIELPLSSPGDEIADPCSLTRYEPSELQALSTAQASYRFQYELDPSIPNGSYGISATAVSGMTDGCDNGDSEYERETAAYDNTTIELP